MPRRQISAGGSPEIRSPLKKTAPDVSGMTPVIRLNTVLLPAPLGPISPWIVDGATVIERSAAACTPPKRRPTARSSSSKGHSHTPASRELPGQRDEPVGRPEHREDQDDAE